MREHRTCTKPPIRRKVEEIELEATTEWEKVILEPAPGTREDSVWVNRCKAGDPDAFEPLVQKFAGQIQRLAWGILGDRREEADDAVQEIFLKAYLALPKFRGDAKFSTWLYRIAVNHCRDILRRSPPKSMPLDENQLANLEDSNSANREAEDDRYALESGKSAETLHFLLSRLNEKHRRIIVMRELENMSYDEIGETLGIPPGTVRSRLNRARASLLQAAEQMRSSKS